MAATVQYLTSLVQFRHETNTVGEIYWIVK